MAMQLDRGDDGSRAGWVTHLRATYGAHLRHGTSAWQRDLSEGRLQDRSERFLRDSVEQECYDSLLLGHWGVFRSARLKVQDGPHMA
eukprot:12310056-Alexandrium_andersonii.AAC.1